MYIYICIHTQIHAFQRHTRQADRWFYCGSLGGSKQKGGNDSSFSLSSPFGSRSFYEQSVWRGFLFFFFWNRAFSLVPPPDLSRYNKRGHEDFCCVPISLGRASLRNSGTRLLFCYLSLFTRSEKMTRKWCSGKKYCLLSNTVIQKCFLPNCFEAIFFRIAISGKQ